MTEARSNPISVVYHNSSLAECQTALGRSLEHSGFGSRARKLRVTARNHMATVRPSALTYPELQVPHM